MATMKEKAKAALSKKPKVVTVDAKQPTAPVEDVTEVHEREKAQAVEKERELAAAHLDYLAAQHVEPQAIGVLKNAAADLRAQRHVTEPSCDE